MNIETIAETIYAEEQEINGTAGIPFDVICESRKEDYRAKARFRLIWFNRELIKEISNIEKLLNGAQNEQANA